MMKLPLAVRDRSPFSDAVRITGTRYDEMPEGVHTGGAWLYENKVYKPLDGRPYVNADAHYRTLEAEMLEECKDIPLFQKNWTEEIHNNRIFLVRNKAVILDKGDYRHLNKELVLQVEQSIREVNRRGWEIGDPIVLGYVNYDYFIVDLSNCQRMNGKGAYAADEDWRIRVFFELCGYDRLIKLRSAGHRLVNPVRVLKGEIPDGYHHVYGSFYRPFSLMWATLPGKPIIEHETRADQNAMIPHSWILTREPLNDDILYKYELTWAWSPIRRK